MLHCCYALRVDVCVILAAFLQNDAVGLLELHPCAEGRGVDAAFDGRRSFLDEDLIQGVVVWEKAHNFRRNSIRWEALRFVTHALHTHVLIASVATGLSSLDERHHDIATHPRLVEARYGIIKVLEEQWPSDFFLLPPPHERDLEDVEATVLALSVFFRHHPDDNRTEALKDLRQKAWSLLSKRQFYLARWNARQGRLRAALARVEGARQRYPNVSEDPVDVEWVKDLRRRAESEKVETKAPELHPARSAFQPEPSP